MEVVRRGGVGCTCSTGECEQVGREGVVRVWRW